MSEEEELPDFDYADPLKRSPEEGEDEDSHGADPAITVPPES